MSQKILQYVEIDVDYCSLTYGVTPCLAFLSKTIVGANFDGTNDYMKRGGGLTGAADSKLCSFSVWLRKLDTAIGGRIIVAQNTLNGGSADGQSRLVFSNTSGRVNLSFLNAAGSTILNFTASVDCAVGEWEHWCGCADMTDSALMKLFRNNIDVSGAITSYANDTIDWTKADWAVGAYADGTSKMFTDIAYLWFAPGVYIDFTVEANRRKFVTDTNAPVALGANGELPTGSSPLVYLGNAFGSFQTNLGTGGDFTVTGALTASTDPVPTGTIKCFNTINTCQDRVNFTNVPVTLRFAVPTNYLPSDIECIANIKQITFDPAVISLGKDLGQRATLTINFDDHRHSDTGAGYDKYLVDRPYDPYNQGTFWGKFRARQPFVRGRPLRWIVGNTDQSLSEMETRHYIIDSTSGPDNNGVFKIIAKDLLKLADGDRALAPAVSEGYLISDITSSDTTLTLTSGAGVGYPGHGYIAIGGSEICEFYHDATAGNDANCKLLLHFDTADATTTFTDSSSSARTATVFGNAQMDDDMPVAKFFNAGLFDGNGDYITFPDSADWPTGTASFTIETFARVTSIASRRVMYHHFTSASTYNLWSITSSGSIKFEYLLSGVTTILLESAASVIAIDTWYHLALVRSGNDWNIYVDGVSVASTTDADSMTDFTSPIRIGADSIGPNYFQGWMDEFRISNIARWTTNFTPPTSPYLTSSDDLIISRGKLNTTASSHSGQDRVQLCVRYESESPEIIIADLLETYAGVDPSYIPLADWTTEIEAHLNRLYTATIAQPTSVNELISELIEQAGLCMWWNDRDQEIGLLVLKGLIYDNYSFSEDNILADTLQITEQPDKRISQVHTYFGQINPLTSLTDKANYRSASMISDAQSETDYGSAAIKEIFSRWIPALGRTIADRLGTIILARFKDAPRKISFSSLRNSTTSEIVLANGYHISSWPLQDATGADQIANVQVTRMRPNPDVIELESEEVLLDVTDAEDLTIRNIIVDSNIFNINLRSAHDDIYPAPESGITVILTVNSGVKVGSTSETTIALDIGSWPDGVTIIVHIVGRVQGHGGHGSGWTTPPTVGGNAIYTRYPINLSCPGQLWSGGGGGGLAAYSAPPYSYIWGGGGGAGYNPGVGGNSTPDAGAPGSNGTTEAGGAGAAYAGAGGGPGLNGLPGTVNGGAGSAAGKSIDGVSFVTTGTWNGTTFTPGALTGDVRGPQVN